MNDRELIELAAKAASYGFQYSDDGRLFVSGIDGIGWKEWNPLEDDGDALRLAVKMNLVPYPPDKSDKRAVCRDYDCIYVDEPPSVDPYASTRRVIVRAAAVIGKSINNRKD